MLHVLSQDPHIFTIVLTPTRELAIQISEKIAALGSSLNVTISLAVGGLDLIQQRLSLAKIPHFLVATPGRLRHHLESADPPVLKKVKYLVLDKADIAFNWIFN